MVNVKGLFLFTVFVSSFSLILVLLLVSEYYFNPHPIFIFGKGYLYETRNKNDGIVKVGLKKEEGRGKWSSFENEGKRKDEVSEKSFQRRIFSSGSMRGGGEILRQPNPKWIPKKSKLSSLRFKKENSRLDMNFEGTPFENLSLTIDRTHKGVCDPNSSFIVALIPSSVGNFKERQLIRKSWANRDLSKVTKLSSVFVLGRTNDSARQRAVERESAAHEDIIQMNVVDSYSNLTFKTMSGLKWVSEHCKEIPWVLKVDDDVLVNPFHLKIALANTLRRDSSPQSILGRLRSHAVPFRKGKWSVTKEEYSAKKYPPFILGSAYIIGRNAVEPLISAALTTKFLHLEDVFFTGVAAEKARISRKNIEVFYYLTKPSASLVKGRSMFLIGDFKDDLKMDIWKKIIESLPTKVP